MIINGTALLNAAPIKDMLTTKIHHNSVSHGLSEAGYDIRIKQTVIFEKDEEGENRVIVATTFKDAELKPGKFIIASAMEEFQMPNNLIGIVHDKSSWARQGLSVFNTVIENGWNGFLTLELVYHGQTKLIIPAGSGIAQVIFHETAMPANYTGRYQNQANKPVEAIQS